MKKIILHLIAVIFLFSSCKHENSNSSKSANDIIIKDSLTGDLDELLKKTYIKGFGVSIINQDSTLYVKGFGLSNIEEKTPYTEQTLQNIASVSKTLIGIALLKAQEMDILHLDDPVSKYLPFEVSNPYYPSDIITIRNLATHTSSILDGELYSNKSYILENEDDFSLAKSLSTSKNFNLPNASMDMGTFLRNFLSQKGKWYTKNSYSEEKRPGEYYEYTNVGATLAAYIIEKTSGQSFSEFTTKYILNPLNMSSSGWNNTSIETKRRTSLYAVDGKKIPNYRLITYPDGGLITSIEDMSKYLSELIKGYSGKGILLSKESYNEFFSKLLSENNFENNRNTDNPYDDEYNSGIFIGHTPDGHIGHTGGDPGVSTFMFFNPKNNIGKILFINTDLDQKGAQHFYEIWKKLEQYEIKLGFRDKNNR